MNIRSLYPIGSYFVLFCTMLGCSSSSPPPAVGDGASASNGGSSANATNTAAGGSTATSVAKGGSSAAQANNDKGGGQVSNGGSPSSSSASTNVPEKGGASSSTSQVIGKGGVAPVGTVVAAAGRAVGRGGAAPGGDNARGGAAAGGAPPVAAGRNGGRAGGPPGGISGRAGGGAASGGSSAASTSAPTAGSTGTSGDAAKSEGCGKTPTLKNGNGLTIDVSGTARKYNLKVPDNYDNSHPYRLIMSYHWLGGTANDVSNGGVAKPYYGLWDLAQGSTIFVAPDGTPNGSGSGNQWANSNGTDVEFSRQLITLIESEFCIDKSRIFCEGFSMGGSMSYAMACGMGDVVRAVAVHSGGTMSGCAKHDKPVAYFMTHGTNDSVCKYPSFPMPPLADFAKLNGCTKPDPTVGNDALAASLPQPTDSSGKTPACVDFEGCKAGYPVRACLFVGDHTPSPGGTSGWVPTETWKFLSQF